MRSVRWIGAALLMAWLCLPAGPGSAQEVAEEILDEELPENVDITSLLEFLEYRRTQPLDLNRAHVSDLTAFPWLSPQLAERIVSWRKTNGPFVSVEQLARVDGVTAGLVERLQPYLTIDTPPQHRPAQRFPLPRISARTRLARRWDAENTRSGSGAAAYRSYQRLQVEAGRTLEAVALWEKDPGEVHLNDFVSRFVGYRPAEGVLFLLGNYQVEAAQGLALWGPYRFGKGGDPVLPLQQVGRGLLGYRSVDETSALSGAAVSVALRSMTAIAFWSQARLDASLLSSGAIRTLDRSGYHRTESETARKDSQQEKLWGARLELQATKRLRLGTTGYRARYQRPFRKTDPARDYFAFEGNRIRLLATDFGFQTGQMTLSGEWARSDPGGWGAVATLQITRPGATVVGLWRRFQPDFHSFRGRAFAEFGPEPGNEEGLYLGVKVTAEPVGHLWVSLDQFRSPWRTTTVPFPRRGYELLLQWKRRINRWSMRLRYRLRRTSAAEAFPVLLGGSRAFLVEQSRQSWRLQIEYAPSSRISMRTRAEIGKFGEQLDAASNAHETGYLLYQQVRWRPRPGWRIEARWTSFDSRSFDSRLFVLENGLPGVWSSVPLYGHGSRWYVLFLSRVGRLRVGWKLAQTIRLRAVGRGTQQPGTLTTKDLGIYLEWTP